LIESRQGKDQRDKHKKNGRDNSRFFKRLLGASRPKCRLTPGTAKCRSYISSLSRLQKYHKDQEDANYNKNYRKYTTEHIQNT
jgi:hypothetical protein